MGIRKQIPLKRSLPDWPRICGGKRVDTHGAPLSWQLQVSRDKLFAMQRAQHAKMRALERALNPAPSCVPIKQAPSRFKLVIKQE